MSQKQDQLQSSHSVTLLASSVLIGCPTEHYLFVSQPNLHASHLASSQSAPRLQKALASPKVGGTVSVAQVAGAVDVKALSAIVKEACLHAGKGAVSVDELTLDAVPATAAEAVVKENDDDVGVVLDQYEAEGSYTVIYMGVPGAASASEFEHYDAQSADPARQELKRELGQTSRRANATDNLPLFEKYQFFTPGKLKAIRCRWDVATDWPIGIFMALVSLVVLFSILGYGIQALASLEVSYGAFDKEMGPAAQKKQQ